MICVSVSGTTAAECRTRMGSAPLAEVRLDLAELPLGELKRLVAWGTPLVATCRPSVGRTEEAREQVLLEAIGAGVRYVDVETEAPPGFKARILAKARTCGCRVMISHHDYQGTPSRAELEAILCRGYADGADLVKLACQVNEPAEAARLLGLLDPPRPLIVVGMGPLGRIVRIAAPLLGSPFTFAAPDAGPATAPGQLKARDLEALLLPLANLQEAP